MIKDVIDKVRTGNSARSSVSTRRNRRYRAQEMWVFPSGRLPVSGA
jgi:hypothetical protein